MSHTEGVASAHRQKVGRAQGGPDLVLGELLHEPPQFEMLTQCMEVN